MDATLWAILKGHRHTPINIGQSGAKVYILDETMVLKYVSRQDVADPAIFDSYMRESMMYDWFRENNPTFAPLVIENQCDKDKIYILMRKYRMLSHHEVTDETLPAIMELLVDLHQMTLPPFLKEPGNTPAEMDAAAIEDCRDGWKSVLSEHPHMFSVSDINIIAEHINDIRYLHQTDIPRLIHGDFHCDNLLSDENGRLFICDWQNAGIGHPAGDLSFFLSRLSADGVELDEDIFIAAYGQASRKKGYAADERVLKQALLSSRIQVSFAFWHQYLHGAPVKRVQTIFSQMTADMQWLLQSM